MLCPRRLLPLLLLAAAPLAAAAPVPKGATPAIYFPTAAGARWEYDCGNDAAEREVVEVTAVETAGGGWAVARKRADGKAVPYRTITASAAGLTQAAAGGEPEWLLKATARAGDSWAVSDGRRTDRGAERVTVAAGTYAARKVEWEQAGGTGLRIMSWYAPGVGEVKRVWRNADGSECVGRSLRAFTPGK